MSSIYLFIQVGNRIAFHIEFTFRRKGEIQHNQNCHRFCNSP